MSVPLHLPCKNPNIYFANNSETETDSIFYKETQGDGSKVIFKKV